MLPVLVRRPAAASRLMALPAWQQLVAAFVARTPALNQQLAQKLHRALAKCLCAAAAGLPDDAQVAAYISHLLTPLGAELGRLVARPDLKDAASQPAVSLAVCCLLEGLRGACRAAALPRAQRPLFAALAPMLAPLLALHAACKAHSHIVALILKVCV